MQGNHENFINLTNGIEAIPNLDEPYSFIRIRSVACEQKRWKDILEDLDYNFLMCAALGKECRIYDYSSQRQSSRALYQGVPWIHFALEKLWYNRTIIPYVYKINVLEYYEECFRRFDVRSIPKLRYFEKFLSGEPVRLTPIARLMQLDGKYETYRRILLSASSADEEDLEALGHSDDGEDIGSPS